MPKKKALTKRDDLCQGCWASIPAHDFQRSLWCPFQKANGNQDYHYLYYNIEGPEKLPYSVTKRSQIAQDLRGNYKE